MEEGGGDLIPFYPLISEKNTFDRLEGPLLHLAYQ